MLVVATWFLSPGQSSVLDSALVWSRNVVKESTYEAQACANITRCALPAHLRSDFTLILCFPKSETMASLPSLSLTASQWILMQVTFKGKNCGHQV